MPWFAALEWPFCGFWVLFCSGSPSCRLAPQSGADGRRCVRMAFGRCGLSGVSRSELCISGVPWFIRGVRNFDFLYFVERGMLLVYGTHERFRPKP